MRKDQRTACTQVFKDKKNKKNVQPRLNLQENKKVPAPEKNYNFPTGIVYHEGGVTSISGKASLGKEKGNESGTRIEPQNTVKGHQSGDLTRSTEELE